MPITGPYSYPEVMQEFISHWGLVNASLGSEMELPNEYTRTDFIAAKAAVDTLFTTVEAKDNTRQQAAAVRDEKKAALSVRLKQFRAAVNGYLGGTRYTASLPRVPAFTTVESRFLRPLVDMGLLWAQINADTTLTQFTRPLLLPGGYALAAYNTDLTALRAAFNAVTDAEMVATTTRDSRDAFLAPTYTRMLEYRKAVFAKLPADDSLLISVPKVTPPSGRTPDPVSVSGVWNAAQGKAVLSWDASEDADVVSYSVRTSPGPTYRSRDETVLASLPLSTRTYATDTGLTQPGATALFKVYTVTENDRERGSAVVKVTRPE